MKKILSLIIILLVSYSVFSQTKEYYSNGKLKSERSLISNSGKVGEYHFYYDDILLSEVTLLFQDSLYRSKLEIDIDGEYTIDIGVRLEGVRNGEWRSYLRNGDISWKGNYINGYKKDSCTYYYDGGRTTGKVNGFYEKYGKWLTFNSRENIIEKGNYKKGLKNGEWFYYDKNGKFKKKKIYKEGTVIGIDTTYYDNGIIKEIVERSNKGEYVFHASYYENGQMRFFQNRMTGVNKSFYKNGQIVDSGKVENKYKVGKWISYFENGAIRKVATYIRDKKNGVEIEYYDNGQVKKEKKFKAIKHEKYVYYLELKHGEFLSYFKNGKLEKKENYLDNKRDGIFEKYYKNSQLKYKEKYKEGTKVGEYAYYYENGQIMIEGNYLEYGEKEKGQLPYIEGDIVESTGENNTGVWRYYHKNGNIWKVGKYYSGIEIGEWKYYYKDGTRKK